MGTAGFRDYHKHQTRHGSSIMVRKAAARSEILRKIKPSIEIKLLVLCPKEIFY
jgi:hypothetical protein